MIFSHRAKCRKRIKDEELEIGKYADSYPVAMYDSGVKGEEIGF